MIPIVSLSFAANLLYVCAKSAEVINVRWTRLSQANQTVLMALPPFSVTSVLKCAAACSRNQTICLTFSFDDTVRLCTFNPSLTNKSLEHVIIYAVAPATQTRQQTAVSLTTAAAGKSSSEAVPPRTTQQMPVTLAVHPGFYCLADGSSCIKPDMRRTVTWADARLACRDMSASLIQVQNITKRDLVTYALINKPDNVQYTVFWADATDEDIEGLWVWADGSAVNTSLFDLAPPPNDTQNNCLMMTTDNPRKFSGRSCYSFMNPLCEITNF